MYKNRFLGVIVGAILIVTVILISKAVGPLTGAEKSSRSYAGMGDVQYFDAERSIAGSGIQGSSRSYAGMGDLQRFGSQLSIAGSGVQGNRRSYAGMGDLHLLEAQSPISSNPGMGDL